VKTIFQLIDEAIRKPKPKPPVSPSLSPDDTLVRAIGFEIEFRPDDNKIAALILLQEQWDHTVAALAALGDPALNAERLSKANDIARECARTGNAEILADVTTKAEFLEKRGTIKRSLKKTLADISTEAGHLALSEIKRFSHEANEWLTDVVESRDRDVAEQFGIPWAPSNTAKELRRAIATIDRLHFGAEPRAILNVLCWNQTF
jgi:hypothetical protein